MFPNSTFETAFVLCVRAFVYVLVCVCARVCMCVRVCVCGGEDCACASMREHAHAVHLVLARAVHKGHQHGQLRRRVGPEAGVGQLAEPRDRRAGGVRRLSPRPALH